MTILQELKHTYTTSNDVFMFRMLLCDRKKVLHWCSDNDIKISTNMDALMYDVMVNARVFELTVLNEVDATAFKLRWL